MECAPIHDPPKPPCQERIIGDAIKNMDRSRCRIAARPGAASVSGRNALALRSLTERSPPRFDIETMKLVEPPWLAIEK